MAESDPVVLPSDQTISVNSNGAYLSTELTSLSILSAVQQQSDYEAKLVVDNLDVTYLEVRIWNSSTGAFNPPTYYLPNSNTPSTPTPPLSYINPNTFLSLIVSNTTDINLEDTQKLVLTAVTNTQTILTNINNKLVSGTDIGDVTINNTGGGSAVNIQDGGNVISIDDAGGSITVDGTVSLSTATLNALESITVQNGAGGSAVNIQDGGNSITVDGAVTANAGTGNFTIIQPTASNLNATIGNGAGGSAVNIQDGGNSITVDANNLDVRDLVFASDKVDVTNSTVALDSATLNALESITVQNGSGGSAVNIQDGGNSITVDGTVTANAGTGNFNVIQATASNLNATIGNGSGSSAVNIQDGGNSITVDGTVTISNQSILTNNPMLGDAFGRLRVSNPLTLFDSSHRYKDNGLWATSTASGGAAVFSANEGLVNLNVNTTSGSQVLRETFKVISYQPGKSLLIYNTFVMAPAQTNLRQRVGYFGADNGLYLQLNNTTLSFVKRSLVTGVIDESVVNQSAWNVDKMDGTGPSGLVLDITKAQILFMDIEWLGEGTVRLGFVIDGNFILCHRFNHANLITSTYITTASLPLRYEITNTGVTAIPSTLKQVCSTALSEGGYELRGAQQAVGTPITTPKTFAVAGTYYPMVGIRVKATALDAIVITTAVSLLGIGNGKNYAWRVVNGAIITGGAWVSAGVDSSVEYNLTGASVSGGRILAQGYVNSSNQGSPSINILKEALFASQLERNTFTGTALEIVIEMAIDTTGGNLGAYASIDWEEVSR